MADSSPPPPPPDATTAARIRRVVVAGHTGDAATVAAHRSDPDASVRASALAAWCRLGRATTADIEAAYRDSSALVRARAAELAVAIDGASPAAVLHDPDPSVVEVACFACGESTWQAGRAPVGSLAAIATDHADPLCRESAAAALGAIGDPAGLDAVLVACADRVTVRRRATLALAAFDDPRADEALHRALDDKDWQVRQAAEDLLGINR